MTARRPLLVTGSHRSGSTWVGRILAQEHSLFYIHEPFSVTDAPGPGICSARFKHWFTYITVANESSYYRPLRNTINLRYDLLSAIHGLRSIRDASRVKREHDAFCRARYEGAKALLKDPIAFFSAGWLAERFGIDVVVVIRHPAAFVSSILKLNWTHPFSHFTAQPHLMAHLLDPFRVEIERFAAREEPVIEQAILLWKLIHHTVLHYQRHHPDWIFVRHEDLSLHPAEAFKVLFNQVGLDFGEQAKQAVEASTHPTHPIDPDAPVGSEQTLQRNSRLNIWNWKARLSPAQIDHVRSQVNEIARHFYADEEW